MAYEGGAIPSHGSRHKVLDRVDVELTLEAQPRAALANSRVKRALDIVGSITALVLLSPVLLAVAVAVKLDSKGPVVFRQLRTGLCGVPFTVLKFRTMRVCGEDGDNAPAEVNDPRLTRLGGFLRRTSLDELPQLLNVLRGDMSLVGPRPHAVDHDLQYLAQIEGYARRFQARPGMTGLSQIKGSRGGGDVFEMRRRAVLDVRYILEWSILLDIKIMVMTIPHLILFRAH